MTLDRGLIDQQLQALGESSRWWDQRELRDLPAVLDSGEQIMAIARGKIARVRLLRRTWLIVVTDRRLLCLRSARTAWRQLEVNGAVVSRVSLSVGPFRGRVRVFAGGQVYRLLTPRNSAYKLAAALSSIAHPAQEAITTFGPVRMVRRVIDHVLALPAAAVNPQPTALPRPLPADAAAMQARLELLEEQVYRLQQQVEFLEQLLHQRHLPGQQVVDLDDELPVGRAERT